MTVRMVLFIPELGGLLMGLDWDMALSEGASHSSEISKHPVEDPARSYVMDYNREQPGSLDIELQVSTDPTLLELGTLGIPRISLLYENLLSLKARQSVEPGALFDVFTGVRIHRNMAIEDIRMDRDSETPNQAVFKIKLMEFRFARSPQQTQRTYLMEANEGPVSINAKELVTQSDRMITEATSVRTFARLGRPTLGQNAIMGAGLSTVGTIVAGAIT